MGQSSQSVVVGLVFFCAATVARAQSPSSTPPPEPAQQASSLTWEDLERLTETDLITVVAPGEATPEEIVWTLIHDASLPDEVRQPFVALAQAKATSLLAPTSAVASVTDVPEP